MNRERAKELNNILQEWISGKTLQCRVAPDGEWTDINDKNDTGFPNDFEYRIKPEPREFWTVGNKTYMGSSKSSQSDAERFLSELKAENPHTDYKDWNVFKVREVIE